MEDTKDAAVAIFDLVMKCMLHCKCLDRVTLPKAKWILQESIKAAHTLQPDTVKADVIVDDN